MQSDAFSQKDFMLENNKDANSIVLSATILYDRKILKKCYILLRGKQLYFILIKLIIPT